MKKVLPIALTVAAVAAGQFYAGNLLSLVFIAATEPTAAAVIITSPIQKISLAF